MIITSDNTATEALIRMLGFDRINSLLRELGFRRRGWCRPSRSSFAA